MTEPDTSHDQDQDFDWTKLDPQDLMLGMPMFPTEWKAMENPIAHGAEGQEWDEARTVLVVMSDKFHARDWVKAEMGDTK